MVAKTCLLTLSTPDGNTSLVVIPTSQSSLHTTRTLFSVTHVVSTAAKGVRKRIRWNWLCLRTLSKGLGWRCAVFQMIPVYCTADFAAFILRPLETRYKNDIMKPIAFEIRTLCNTDGSLPSLNIHIVQQKNSEAWNRQSSIVTYTAVLSRASIQDTSVYPRVDTVRHFVNEVLVHADRYQCDYDRHRSCERLITIVTASNKQKQVSSVKNRSSPTFRPFLTTVP